MSVERVGELPGDVLQGASDLERPIMPLSAVPGALGREAFVLTGSEGPQQSIESHSDDSSVGAFNREFDFFDVKEVMEKKSKYWIVEAESMFDALVASGRVSPDVAKAIWEHIKDEKARPRSKAVDRAFDSLRKQRVAIGGLKPSDRYPEGLETRMDKLAASFLEGSKKPSEGYIEHLLYRLGLDKNTADFDIHQARCLAVAIIRELYADELQV